MGSRDLWRDSSFSGCEVRGFPGRKPKQRIHSSHTCKTDNSNTKASNTAAHCNKSAVTIVVNIWKSHPSFEPHATSLCINKEEHCVMQDVTVARKSNIVNSVVIQQLRRVQGSNAQAKLKARGTRALRVRGQKNKSTAARAFNTEWDVRYPPVILRSASCTRFI